MEETNRDTKCTAAVSEDYKPDMFSGFVLQLDVLRQVRSTYQSPNNRAQVACCVVVACSHLVPWH